MISCNWVQFTIFFFFLSGVTRLFNYGKRKIVSASVFSSVIKILIVWLIFCCRKLWHCLFNCYRKKVSFYDWRRIIRLSLDWRFWRNGQPWSWKCQFQVSSFIINNVWPLMKCSNLLSIKVCRRLCSFT